MHIKIQSSGMAGGSNAGSCRRYAKYLAHENLWKEEHGMNLDLIPFYSKTGAAVSESEVIKAIDSNKSQLHANDAKFFSCIISFSSEELFSMGENREERIASAHLITEKIMDRYAQGFGTDKVKDRNDLLYFYTMHEMREKEDGVMSPGLHIHVIISRKDASNKYKISPMTTYKEGSEKSVIKRGFSRDAFFRDCELLFDKTFNHKRKVEESYAYCNAMAHGTSEEKEIQIQRAVDEKRISEKISAALSARIKRMAEEACQSLAKNSSTAINEDKIRRNRYWNEYFSSYKPQIAELRKTCDATFRLYSDARDKYKIQSADLTAQYEKLKAMYAKMDRMEKAIASATTAPSILLVIAALIALVNPIPAIILGLVTKIVASPIAKVTRTVLVASKQDLRRQAADIRESITDLKEKQEKLKELKSSNLNQYLKVKDEKRELQLQMDNLKKELEKPLSNGMTADLAKRFHEYLKSHNDTGKVLDSGNPAETVHSLIFSSKDLVTFENELRKRSIRFEEVIHPNGGVADFLITVNDNLNSASHMYPGWQMAELLDMWENLTGHIPAYKNQNEEQPKIKMKL